MCCRPACVKQQRLSDCRVTDTTSCLLQPRSLAAIALEVVREAMFILLIASGAIYLRLGDAAEALALLAAVFLVIGITLYQEQKTERALQALRELSSPRALVIRMASRGGHRKDAKQAVGGRKANRALRNAHAGQKLTRQRQVGRRPRYVGPAKRGRADEEVLAGTWEAKVIK